MIELSALRQLLFIAESGTFTGAARRLHISQPSLTQSIQRLESDLQAQLLFRDTRGARLTESGRVLLEAAGDVFERLERAERTIRALEAEDDVGRFVVGCHESLGGYFMPGFLSELHSVAPKLVVNLWNGPSAAVRKAVLEREVDFGLIVNPESHPDLVLVPLFRDGVEAFVGAGEPQVKSRAEALRRVRRGPLIYAGRVQQARDIIARLEAEGALPERQLSCGDLEMVKSLAIAGLGVALLPRRVARYRSEGLLRSLHPGLPAYPDLIRLVYRSDLHRTRAAVRLKDALVAYGKGLEGEDTTEVAPPSE